VQFLLVIGVVKSNNIKAGINLNKIGKNTCMRNIKQDIAETIRYLNEMKGKQYIIEVNRGRNRIETINGAIENTYPSVFTVRNANGDVNTFSYADLLSRNIKFKTN
jgi:uncharacterized protein Veg